MSASSNDGALKAVRFKMDVTIQATGIADAKEQIARFLLEEAPMPQTQNASDGWCCGAVEDWHYAESCW